MVTVAATFVFASCVKNLDKYGFSDTTVLKGRVIEESEQTPVSGVNISVTNGSYTHSSTTTNSNGNFEINVDYTKIAKDYYLLLNGGSMGKTRQAELKGMGQEMYDYQTIILYNKTNTEGIKAKTKEVTSITATTAVCTAEVIIGVDVRLVAKGVCWSVNENPTITDAHTDDGNNSGSYSSNITELTEKTTYYVRAYGKTNDTVCYGEQLSFTTPAMFASIQYNGKVYHIYYDVEAMNWSSAMAFCENLTAGGHDDWFLPNKDELNALYINRQAIGNFSEDKYWSSSEINSNNSYCQDFTNGTQSNEKKSTNNKVRPVRTGNNEFTAPTVITTSISNITRYYAECYGNVTQNGGSAVTEKGICYSTMENPTIISLHVSGGDGIGTFSCSLTDLEQSTMYYVRAYATNSIGTAYGEQKSFVTLGPPIVTTDEITSISATSASCSGNVIMDCGESVTQRGICYSLSPNPTTSDHYVISSSGTGPFTCNITGLTNNTTYYVRAYAKNYYGTSYGEEVTFTTELFPTFIYGGHIYQVAPEPGTKMTWNDAKTHCDNLTLYGISGWRLPTKDELLQMCVDKYLIGGFDTSLYYSQYWSSTQCSSASHYFMQLHDCSRYEGSNDQRYRVRPIRRVD